ncbi:hypothetical protein [Jiangella alba]|uniref:hypothetical protein n=1 Tax=Jiangella alba TaxID=561176 RepID=UPI00114CCFE8|nr:hypothetical protein [Jiangella alba]
MPTSLDVVFPDLILAVGDDGTEGYVRAADINPPSSTSPEQAVAEQEARLDANGDWKVPLYAEDGTTVIGTYTVYVKVGEPRP